MKKRSSLDDYATHEEITNAMEAFLKKGGKIKMLPQQKVVTINVIGSAKYSAYETIQDLII